MWLVVRCGLAAPLLPVIKRPLCRLPASQTEETTKEMKHYSVRSVFIIGQSLCLVSRGTPCSFQY